jgi:hypothetical protein
MPARLPLDLPRIAAPALLALALLALVAACGAEAVAVPTTTAASATSAASATTAAPGPITVAATEFDLHGLPATASAGTYSLTLRNDGDEPHQMVLLRPRDGVSIDEIVRGGAEVAFEGADLGGIVVADGGATSRPVDVTLTTGQWYAVCFVATPIDGQSHAHHGMAAAVTVVA